MSLRPQTLCDVCHHFRPGGIDGSPPSCTAFPEGIPDQILVRGFDHRRPFPGDNGVRFARDPDKPLPAGYPETVEDQQPIFVTEPQRPIREQTSRELRQSAKNIIDAFREQRP